MKEYPQTPDTDTQQLLSRFNRRDDGAFGEVYTLLYKELYYFARMQWGHADVGPEDIIQDVFLNILKHNSVKFNSLSELKAYLYTSIRNGYLVRHNRFKVFDRIKDRLAPDDHETMLHAAEARIFSMIPDALGMLPEECARTFKLYLEGWDVQEIAARLGKKPSTIYNQRRQAIEILRKRISKDSLTLLLALLG